MMNPNDEEKLLLAEIKKRKRTRHFQDRLLAISEGLYTVAQLVQEMRREGIDPDLRQQYIRIARRLDDDRIDREMKRGRQGKADQSVGAGTRSSDPSGPRETG